jgi:hypothetical protein
MKTKPELAELTRPLADTSTRSECQDSTCETGSADTSSSLIKVVARCSMVGSGLRLAVNEVMTDGVVQKPPACQVRIRALSPYR